MADDTDTPTTDTSATPRRRAPRATSTTRANGSKTAAAKTRTRASGTPSTVDKVETAVSDTAKTVTRRAKTAAAKAEGAVASAAKAVKPRSTKRATPRTTAAGSKKPVPRKKDDGASKLGGKWGVAAVGAGVAAVGAAAAAALLSLRGSTPKEGGRKAHAPDGRDASKSFQAGIADENTIPEKV